MERPAPTGNVTTQDITILPTTPKSMAERPLASPTPKTAPTKVCVVEIGSPVPEAKTTVEAAAISAEKPKLGVSVVILLPTVLITLPPSIANPKTIPMPPKRRTHGLTTAFDPIAPSEVTLIIADIGPIAFATSLEP